MNAGKVRTELDKHPTVVRIDISLPIKENYINEHPRWYVAAYDSQYANVPIESDSHVMLNVALQSVAQKLGLDWRKL